MRTTLRLILVMLVTSCGGAVVSNPVPEATVLVAETSGGCAQIGPNCVSIVVRGDGLVDVYRITPAGPEQIDSGRINPELVSALSREVAAVDQLDLLDSLPPGECRGCYDGIDTSMIFPTIPTPIVTPTFSSVDVELDRSVPLFEAAWAVYEAALDVIEVPVIAR